MAIRYVNKGTSFKAFIIQHHICSSFSGPLFLGHAVDLGLPLPGPIPFGPLPWNWTKWVWAKWWHLDKEPTRNLRLFYVAWDILHCLHVLHITAILLIAPAVKSFNICETIENKVANICQMDAFCLLSFHFCCSKSLSQTWIPKFYAWAKAFT